MKWSSKVPGRSSRGFTLIELLIVIAILAVISVAVVLSVRGLTASSRLSAAKSEMRVLQLSVDSMMADARVSSIGDKVPTWRGQAGEVIVNADGGTIYDAHDYLKIRYEGVKGSYAVYPSGKVECYYYEGVDLAKVNG